MKQKRIHVKIRNIKIEGNLNMGQLSKTQLTEYQNNGFLILENLLDADEVKTLGDRIIQASNGELLHLPQDRFEIEKEVVEGKVKADTYGNSLSKISRLAFNDQVFDHHARNPKILDIIESILGEDIKLYQDQLFMKPPKIGSRQKYHQDQPLGFCIDPPEMMVTAWTAVDDSTQENGCLWMLKGSHKEGPRHKEESENIERAFEAGTLKNQIPLTMKAGSVSLHHGLIFHSSTVNNSNKSRRGYATHYISGKCTYKHSQRCPKQDATVMKENANKPWVKSVHCRTYNTSLMRGKTYPGCV